MNDELRDELTGIVENETGGCNCHEAWTIRGRIDPQCEFHICIGLVDEIVPIISRRIAQARAAVAEEIAQAFIDRAAKASRRRGVSQDREHFLNGRLSAFQDAADIARQHAGEVSDDE